jgi:hypothetical protein
VNSDLNDLLAKLHIDMVESLLKKIKNGEATDKELEVARKLLAQNGIVVEPRAKGNLLGLAEALPFKTGTNG